MIFRGSQEEVFYENFVRTNYAKFTSQHLCGSIFLDKVAVWSMENYNVVKKRLQHKCFSMNFA